MAAGSGTVAETLILEMDARDQQLQAKLTKLQTQLSALEATGTKTGVRVAGGGEMIGQRFAIATRQIASAGEAAARAGELGGAAAKSMLAQGSNMAFMFGPAGAIAGGVAITTLAIVEMFQRSRKEMEETRNKFRAELEQMGRARDLSGLDQRKGALYRGDPFALRNEGETDAAFRARRGGWRDVSARLRELGPQMQAAGAETTLGRARARLSGKGALIDEFDELETLQKELDKKLTELDPVWRKAMADLVKAGADEIAAKGPEVLAAWDAFMAELTAQIAQAGSTAADVYRAETDKIVQQTEAKIAKLGDPAKQRDAQALVDQFKQVRAAQADYLDLQQDITAADREAEDAMADLALQAQVLANREAALIDVMKDGSRSRDDRRMAEEELSRVQRGRLAIVQQQQAAATGEIDRVRAEVRALNLQRTAATATQIDVQIAAKEKRIRELELQIAALKGEGAKAARTTFELTKKTTDELERQARAIQSGVAGAIELANAFGLMDDRTSSVLRNVGAIAANAPLALASGAGQFSAILGVVGGLAGLASSLFGDSPAEKERRKRLEENTIALQELTENVGLLGVVGVSGSDISRGRSGAATAFAIATARERFARDASGPGSPGFQRAASELDKALKAAGPLDAATRKFLDDLAKEFGLTLDGTAKSFALLQAAIEAASVKLAEFTDDFGGVTDWIQFQNRIFGDQGPLKNLQTFLQSVGRPGAGGSKGIANILNAGDPNTAEGRAAMRALIEQYASVMAAGGAQLGADILGGLSGDEFKNALLQIIEYLNALDSPAGSGPTGTGGFSVSRTITEVTGDRIAGLLTAANAFQERIALAVESIVARIVPIESPAIYAGAAGGGMGNSITIESIELVFELPAAAAGSGEAVGEAAGSAFVATIRRIMAMDLSNADSEAMVRIDSSLQVRVRQRERSTGNNAI
jgi:hypothetical protein